MIKIKLKEYTNTKTINNRERGNERIGRQNGHECKQTLQI